jgi:hypothetical protein
VLGAEDVVEEGDEAGAEDAGAEVVGVEEADEEEEGGTVKLGESVVGGAEESDAAGFT